MKIRFTIQPLLLFVEHFISELLAKRNTQTISYICVLVKLKTEKQLSHKR